MRDSLSTLLMALLIYQFVLWGLDKKKRNLLGYMVLFLLNSLIRVQNAVLLLVTSLPHLLKTMRKKAHPLLRPIMYMVAFSCIVGIIVLFYALDLFHYASFEYLSREMQWRAYGGTQYLTWMSYNNWFDVLLYAPLRTLYFMFSPFPWDVSSPAQAVAASENLMLMLMSITLIKNWKKVRSHCTDQTVLASVVLIFLVGIIANAVVDGNSGTALRHKLQYIYILFVLYAASRVKNQN